MPQGIRFHHEFSTGNLGTQSNRCVITIEHGDGSQDTVITLPIKAVKDAIHDGYGRTVEYVLLGTEEDMSAVYRVEADKVVVHVFYRMANHWEAAYDQFVRCGGWAGNMKPTIEPTTTTVRRIVS